MADTSVSYKCPKCGTLFDEQNNAYTKNEEDYYEEDENLGS